ncbi:MAG: tRNA (N6-threonylcarbamoyladenosine(37)-N6)-methyltransferase TrmO [Thermodesulfobacteriota bacterium]|nr:tRNA (N6-threonylcarbamoyladenosine(37)-N6)-methyltransferase TrmO [Thermodesulfobacteriota bacterium]
MPHKIRKISISGRINTLDNNSEHIPDTRAIRYRNGRNEEFIIRPVGIINTPHKDPSRTPIQPVFARGIKGTVTVNPEYSDGLLDLDKFSHIYLLYYFHKCKDVRLILKPYLEDKDRGLFATRAPCRPNPLGISIVRLLSVMDNILQVEDVDILDNTPLIDIKPYVKRFDSRDNVRSGWQDDIEDDAAEILGLRDFKKS